MPTLAPLVNQVTPAVVNISVVTRSPMEDNPLFRDPFFKRFFNLPERPQRDDLAQHTDGLQAREHSEIDGRLGVSGTAQHATVLRP